MINQGTVIQKRHRHVGRCALLTAIGIALGLGLGATSAAHASTYRVYTATAANSMAINATDGNVCTLAEAVEHAKGTNVDGSGRKIKYCDDFDPTSGEQRIELLESPNKPFSTNHFAIKNNPLTLKRTNIPIHIFGSGGFIDSTTYSAFVIPLYSIAFFERVTLTNTAGSAGGRLIENYGELKLYGVTITGGDVTGSQHGKGVGGGIYNGSTSVAGTLFPAVISVAQSSLITSNKARKGGGIYNDSGIISDLQVSITNNTATLAGGGIYNISTTPKDTPWTNGKIDSYGTIVADNRARTGGGIFNRGVIHLNDGSSITGNFTTTTGTSGETCTGSASCDGSGGGVLNAHISANPSTTPPTPSGSDTRFNFTNSTISNNTASARGGAFYSVGLLQVTSSTISGNVAKAGGAVVFIAPPTDGAQQYCAFSGGFGGGPIVIDRNCVTSPCSNTTSLFSIVDGTSAGAADFRRCSFGLQPSPDMIGTRNSSPLCNRSAVDPSSDCPQLSQYNF